MPNHDIDKIYNESLRELEISDSVHKDILNPIFSQLINNDAHLTAKFNNLFVDIEDFPIIPPEINDGPRILRALESTPVGGTLFFGVKTFTYSIDILIQKAINLIGSGRSGVFGATEGTKLKGINGAKIIYQNPIGGRIEGGKTTDMVLEGDSDTTYILDATNVERHKFARITFTGNVTNGWAMRLRGTNSSGSYRNLLEQVDINPTVKYGIEIFGDGEAGPNNTIFINCSLYAKTTSLKTWNQNSTTGKMNGITFFGGDIQNLDADADIIDLGNIANTTFFGTRIEHITEQADTAIIHIRSTIAAINFLGCNIVKVVKQEDAVSVRANFIPDISNASNTTGKSLFGEEVVYSKSPIIKNNAGVKGTDNAGNNFGFVNVSPTNVVDFDCPSGGYYRILFGGTQTYNIKSDAFYLNSGKAIFFGGVSAIYSGSNSPEGVVTANVGSIYMKNNGSGLSLYVKESGTGNTGWVAK